MKFIAFLFILIGAALNIFQSVISVPASVSTFTGSMYDALMSIINYIGENGLSGEVGEFIAIIIFVVLCLIPIIALAACVIYYISCYILPESSISAYFVKIIPYAQKISPIAPIIWAICYFIASFLVPKPKENLDFDKKFSGSSIIFGIGWSNKEKSKIDLDASAFLLDSNDKVSRNDDIIFHRNEVHKSGALWLTGDIKEGVLNKKNTQKSTRNDLEQIIVLLDKVPPRIKKIVFVVSASAGKFEAASSAYARLIEKVTVDEEHIANKSLIISDINGEELTYCDLKNNQYSGVSTVIVAEIFRSTSGGWSYRETKKAFAGDFKAVCENVFGI